jgi:hypothetical protein
MRINWIKRFVRPVVSPKKDNVVAVCESAVGIEKRPRHTASISRISRTGCDGTARAEIQVGVLLVLTISLAIL